MSNNTLTSEQIQYFMDLLKTGVTLTQITSALKERDRGRSYRSDRGKGERLSAKLARQGKLTTADITAINSRGLGFWNPTGSGRTGMGVIQVLNFWESFGGCN